MDTAFTPLNILVVEDNDDLRETIIDALNIQGHAAQGVRSAELARAFTSTPPPDLYVVDLNLPGEDGLSLSAWLRQTRPEVGIVMLTARGQSKERLAGYQHGADIYLTKPASMDELKFAIQSLSRRLYTPPATSATNTSLWQLRMAPPSLVSPNGAVCPLTGIELKLLAVLAQNQPHPATREKLAMASGQGNPDYDLRRVEVAFSRLRKKLANIEPDLPLIQAIRGEGYIFGGTLKQDF